MSLAVAILAEHVTTGTPLPELIGRLGVADKASLAASCLEVESAAIALRDLAAPRNGSVPAPVEGQSVKDGNHRMPNRYKGKCRCTRWVPEGRGWAVKTNGKWTVECRACGEGK